MTKILKEDTLKRKINIDLLSFEENENRKLKIRELNKTRKQYFLEYQKDNRQMLSEKDRIYRNGRHPSTYKKKPLEEWINNIKETTPCTDCNKYFPPECMDFDHITVDKKYNIPKLYGSVKNKEKLKEEMKKCEIVCSNCHRSRTVDRASVKRGMRYFNTLVVDLKQVSV